MVQNPLNSNEKKISIKETNNLFQSIKAEYDRFVVF